MKDRGRATLTLTVSLPNSSSEELRISVPMEVIEGSSSSQTPSALSSTSESSRASQLSGILSETSLNWEQSLRAIDYRTVVDMASNLMDQPGVNMSLAEAIVYVMKNLSVSLLLETIKEQLNEQE